MRGEEIGGGPVDHFPVSRLRHFAGAYTASVLGLKSTGET